MHQVLHGLSWRLHAGTLLGAPVRAGGADLHPASTLTSAFRLTLLKLHTT